MFVSRRERRRRDKQQRRRDALARTYALLDEIRLEKPRMHRSRSERGPLSEARVVAAFREPHLRPSGVANVYVAPHWWDHCGVDIFVVMTSGRAFYLQIKTSPTGLPAFFARYAFIAGRLVEVVIIDPYESPANIRRKVMQAVLKLRSQREARLADIMPALVV